VPGIVVLDLDPQISGNIDSETRIINAMFIGGDDAEGMKITGKLSADGSRAEGTGPEGMTWSVSR